MKFIIWIGRRIRGPQFSLDEKIPLSYLLQLIISTVCGIIIGLVKFRKVTKLIIVGRSSSIRCVSKIQVLGKQLTLKNYVVIDALSTDGVVFANRVSIGNNVKIECSGTLSDIGKGLLVGNNVGIGADSFLGCAGGIAIGDDTIIGNYVSFHSENHNFNDLQVPIRCQGVNRQGISIGKNCWIGARVIILDGVTVEDGCIVAAGAVLTAKRYPKNSVIAGIPAKVLKTR